MNLKEEILKEHSKSHTLFISGMIGSNQLLFDQLLDIVCGNQPKISQRGAWILRQCVESFPHLINLHHNTLIRALEDPIHPAIPRNILCVLKGIKLKEEDLGKLVDICFRFVESPSADVAIRSNAMSILFEICKDEPELAKELILVIETFLPHGSAGFKSKGNKVIKGLIKIHKLIP